MRWESIHYADSRPSQSESAEPVEPVHDLPTSALATSHRTQASRESISGWVLIARPDNSDQGYRLIPHILFHTTADLPPGALNTSHGHPVLCQNSPFAIAGTHGANGGKTGGIISFFKAITTMLEPSQNVLWATLRVFKGDGVSLFKAALAGFSGNPNPLPPVNSRSIPSPLAELSGANSAS